MSYNIPLNNNIRDIIGKKTGNKKSYRVKQHHQHTRNSKWPYMFFLITFFSISICFLNSWLVIDTFQLKRFRNEPFFKNQNLTRSRIQSFRKCIDNSFDQTSQLKRFRNALEYRQHMTVPCVFKTISICFKYRSGF